MKFYELNLKDDEDVNYDEFIENNKEFMKEFWTLSYNNPNEKIIYLNIKVNISKQILIIKRQTSGINAKSVCKIVKKYFHFVYWNFYVDQEIFFF